MSFPFWARLKIAKNRPTLVIDETKKIDKKTGKVEDCYVHREATHSKNKNNESIIPNPNPKDKRPMYLKRPRSHPKRLFKKNNQELSIPKHLVDKYSKNNK